MRPGTLLIDSSTIAPDEARGAAALSRDKSADFIDAPVSGGMWVQRCGYIWRCSPVPGLSSCAVIFDL